MIRDSGGDVPDDELVTAPRYYHQYECMTIDMDSSFVVAGWFVYDSKSGRRVMGLWSEEDKARDTAKWMNEKANPTPGPSPRHLGGEE